MNNKIIKMSIYQILYFGLGAYISIQSYLVMEKLEGQSSHLRRAVEGLLVIGTLLMSISVMFFIVTTQCDCKCTGASITKFSFNSMFMVLFGVPLLALSSILLTEGKSMENDTLTNLAISLVVISAGVVGVGLIGSVSAVFSRGKQAKLAAAKRGISEKTEVAMAKVENKFKD